MRRGVVGALAVALATPAVAMAQAHPPAAPMDATGHHQRTYSFVQTEADYGRLDGGHAQATWEADAWIGGDRRKLWLKSEAELTGGELEAAEVQALYSRKLAAFFDAQVGLRYDVEPRGTVYLVAGVQGLAPYLLETDLAAFLSDHGDLGVRLEQSVDLLLTQRLILEPQLELEAQLRDAPERRLASGVEASLQLRYEITRKFAPYVTAAYARALGATADGRRDDGEAVGGWAVRAGVRSWF